MKPFSALLLFGGRKHGTCTLHIERQPPRELAVESLGRMIEVTLPELKLWGVLEFRRDGRIASGAITTPVPRHSRLG